MRAYYVDTSALVKLVQRESESAALRRWIMSINEDVAMSVIGAVELRRATRRSGLETAAADEVLSRIDLIAVTPSIVARAGQLDPVELRSLDALHLATAAEIGEDLAGIVAYDSRLLGAAERAGFVTLSPS